MLHPGMKLSGTFWIRDPAPDAAELRAVARVVPVMGSPEWTRGARGSISTDLHEIAPDRFFRTLRDLSVQVLNSSLLATYEPEFWAEVPDDCAGAVLRTDGHVRLLDSKDNGRVVPLAEPLVIRTRPVSDTGGPGSAPHVLNGGGIPILSERLLATLRDLGAEGETADVLYRGTGKDSVDTVQPGYRRFLVRPEVETGRPPVDFLPHGLADDFGICGFRRPRGDDARIEIALDRERADELRRRRRTVLMGPIFRRDGPVASILRSVEEAAREFGFGPVR